MRTRLVRQRRNEQDGGIEWPPDRPTAWEAALDPVRRPVMPACDDGVDVPAVGVCRCQGMVCGNGPLLQLVVSWVSPVPAALLALQEARAAYVAAPDASPALRDRLVKAGLAARIDLRKALTEEHPDADTDTVAATLAAL